MEIHKDFHKKLTSRYPDLTNNDRRLCAFIMLNMSTKDISSITYQSLHSIKIARYRLRKKLGLDKNENLSAFLHAL
jgi:DNA-binding CsgD family transcriptional regulator